MFKRLLIKIKEANSNILIVIILPIIILLFISINNKINKIDKTPYQIVKTEEVNYNMLANQIAKQKIDMDSKCLTNQVSIFIKDVQQCVNRDNIYINSLDDDQKLTIKSLESLSK